MCLNRCLVSSALLCEGERTNTLVTVGGRGMPAADYHGGGRRPGFASGCSSK